MFCPQCGQQQLSDEVRFCSRCGFPLRGVTALLTSGGEIPQGIVVAGAGEPSPRRKGARQGFQWMLLGIFLSPFFAIMHEIIRTPDKLALIGVMVFLAGLLRLIFALIFADGPLRQQRSATQLDNVLAQDFQRVTAPRRGVPELTAAQGTPVRAYVPPRVDTAEISYRPSVTENTTRLLEHQDDSPSK
ncbi:MAG: zinc ribbon domain-containing protein [Pyrinomonadaceae bacterium]